MFENFDDLATAPCLCCTIGDLEHFSVSTVVFHIQYIQYLNQMDLEHGCLFRIVAFLITLEVDSLWIWKLKARLTPLLLSQTLSLHSFVNLKQGWFLFSSVISSGGLSSEHYVQVFWKFEVWLLAFRVQLFWKNAVVA